MAYLKAYQAYQKQNYDYCLTLLQEQKQCTRKQDLQAQVYFQKGEYQKAYDIYQELIENGNDTKERRENIQTLIVCAQLEQPGQLKLKGKDRLPTSDEIIDQVELINLNDPTVENLVTKPKRTKKRKIRQPKFNPEKELDPERWIPRRDRKAEAHKKKRRNIKGRKGRP